MVFMLLQRQQNGVSGNMKCDHENIYTVEHSSGTSKQCDDCESVLSWIPEGEDEPVGYIPQGISWSPTYNPDEQMDDDWISRAYENPRVWMNQEQKRQDDVRRLNDETWTKMSGR